MTGRLQHNHKRVRARVLKDAAKARADNRRTALQKYETQLHYFEEMRDTALHVVEECTKDIAAIKEWMNTISGVDVDSDWSRRMRTVRKTGLK